MAKQKLKETSRIATLAQSVTLITAKRRLPRRLLNNSRIPLRRMMKLTVRQKKRHVVLRFPRHTWNMKPKRGITPMWIALDTPIM